MPSKCQLLDGLHECVDKIFVNFFNSSDIPVNLEAGYILGTIEDAVEKEGILQDFVVAELSEAEISKRIPIILEKIRIGKNLTDTQRAELIALLVQNYDCFQWQDGPPGCTNMAVHSIPTAIYHPHYSSGAFTESGTGYAKEQNNSSFNWSLEVSSFVNCKTK